MKQGSPTCSWYRKPYSVLSITPVYSMTTEPLGRRVAEPLNTPSASYLSAQARAFFYLLLEMEVARVGAWA